jgi:hypothetical protein
MIKKNLSPQIWNSLKKLEKKCQPQYSNPDHLQPVDTCPSILTITPRIHMN